MAWCTALAAILSVGCLIAMLAAGHGALRTLCLCAALALLVLAFVAAGVTLRQRAQRAQYGAGKEKTGAQAAACTPVLLLRRAVL